MKRYPHQASLAVIAALLMVGRPALAQSNPATESASGVESQDIVVTAQFREQRLQDTPISITAVSADTLAARDQRSVADIGEFAPNVNISQASSLNGNGISAFIRGIGQDSGNFALEPGVGMYIDDVYYGTTFGALFDLTDLDRAEILRGPQGTLAGKNSIGGAIKLFTKKPNATDGGVIEGTYGRFNRYDIRASANFAISDSLFARFSAVAKGSEGYLTRLDYGCVNPGQGIPSHPSSGTGSCKIGTEGGQDVKGLRLAVRYAPTGSRLEVNIAGDVTRDNSEIPPQKLIYANFPGLRSYDAANPLGGVPYDSRFLTPAKSYTNYATYCDGGNYDSAFGLPYQVQPSECLSNKATAKSWGVSGTIDYELADGLSLKSISAYRSVTGVFGSDIDSSPLNFQEVSAQFSHRQFTQELRINGRLSEILNYTVGGYYYDAQDRQSQRVTIPNVLLNFLADDPVSNKSASLFLHTEFKPLENLGLIGGLRYTHDKKTYTFHRTNIDGTLPVPGPFVAPSGGNYPGSWLIAPAGGGLDLVFPENFLVAGLDGVRSTYKKNRVDWRVGVNYRWNDGLMTYAQVATGYKGGGINPIPYVADQALPFGPEKLTSYEVGFKADIADKLLRLNASAFYNDYSGIQMTIYYCAFSSLPSPCALRANAGNAHSKGVELEASLHPMAGLTIEGNVGYLDFNYTKVNPDTGVSLGMVAPYNNKWQASASIQYIANIGDFGTLTPRVDWNYRSSFYSNAINLPENKVSGISVFNARLTLADAARVWSVSTGVTNLFNKFYYNSINENLIGYGLAGGFPGRPREWSMTVRRTF